ncbi:MAG: preprotein translocase subunit SecY [Candidatus Tokpelaia sp. JSC161]|jgi:preprotein translocase subunit SecY|nr:MAG: preprotein translocase subunit SecY [Candidatus Tokpelaia sp. JSC161]
MASAAEQLASNLNFLAFSRAHDLKKRMWFTIGALLVYRLGTYIPMPGLDANALRKAFDSHSSGVFGIFNMFAGGAVSRMAIFTLGIMPYISASIIIQLMTSVVPFLEALKKEGDLGRQIINQYTRYGAIFLAVIQAYGISLGLESGNGIVSDPGWFFRFSAVLTLLGGTMFLMWLGEQITSRGIGNGISLIIFSGIVSGLPMAIFNILDLSSHGEFSAIAVLGIFSLVVLIIFCIIFVERAQRRILVQYPKRQIGNRIFQGDSSHLPLKLNSAGVIPPIFASSLLLLPATIGNFSQNLPDWVQGLLHSLSHGHPIYMLLYAGLMFFFCFFYTGIVFNPKDTAEQLKKQGGFIPGIRPGEKTAEYIDFVLSRITLVGALYIILVCLFPELVVSFTGISLALGGTSLLIVVTVTLDTVAQIQGHLMAYQYEGLIKKSNLRGSKRKK